MKYLKIVMLILIAGSLGFTYFNGNSCIFCSLLKSQNINPGNERKLPELNNQPLVLNESNFDSEVLKSQIPVVVDFYASWCGPCKKLSPVIDELSNEYSGKIKFGKLNVDDNEKITASYDINSIPHLIVFVSGKPAEHIIGLQSKNEIQTKLNQILEAAK